jgi:hypothetical protein
MYYNLGRARVNPPTIRRLPTLDQLDDGIGRATEMGRPVWVDYADSQKLRTGGRQTGGILAGINVLSYVARKCAQMDCDLVVPCGSSDHLPIAEETVRSAFLAEGKIDQYKPDTVRYISEDTMAFQAGVVGMIMREKPATGILVGAPGWPTQAQLESLNRQGAVTIAGVDTPTRLHDMACADYGLYGSDIFATAAYLTKDPLLSGSIRAQDTFNLLGIAIIVIGLLLEAAGVGIISQLLKF